MDPVACFPEERKIVSVVGSELVENYTVYIIEVRDGDHKWTVKHRYSDFHDLHQKLTAEKKVDKQLLPPKKMLGKNSKSLVEKRQKELDVYLHTLLSQFTTVTPKALSCFLHFNLYEVNGVTAALAEELFHRGDQLLLAGEVFTLRPLQLYSVTQQLRQAKPTCCTGDAKTDLGHILDFTCRLRYLKISGSKGPIGSSNIQENNLPFDLSVFKSLIHIEISECCWQQITGLPSLRSNLATLSIHNSTDNMMSILVPEAAEFSQWEVEGVESQCPVTAIIPVWEQLTTVDMSHNVISEIDGSVKVIPKVEFLDLSHNQLCSVDNLQLLYNLIHLDVSYNRMCVLESVHTRLGNIKTLNLAGNQLVTLSGLTKLYSLVNLDLSYNQLTQLEEVRHIGSLPCLERLSLNNNPVCIDPDYRTKVLAQFCDRAAEVCLDGTSTTEKELDTVEVLKAIQRARETRERRNNTEPTISEETRLSAAAPPPPPHLSPSCFSSSAVTPPPPAVTSSPCSLPTPPPPPCVAQPAATQERERKLKEEVEGEKERIKKTKHKEVNMGQEELFSPPIMQTPPPPTTNTQHLTQKPAVCLSSCHTSTHQHIHTSEPVDGSIVNSCPLLLSHLLSLSSSNKDFITQLSQRLQGSTLQEKEDKQRRKEVEVEERRCESGGEETEVLAPSNRSGPGYFEMGLDDCHSKVEVPSSSPPQQQGLEVSRVVWCHCVRVEKTLRQMEACLVLTDSLLGLFYVSTDLTSTKHDTAEEQVQRQEEVVGLLQRDLLLPYSHVLLLSSSCSDLLPASCLVLGHSSSSTRWFLFSDVQSITDTTALLSAQLNLPSEPHPTPPPLLRPLLTSWEVEENQSPQGGYPAFLLSSSSSSSEPSPFLSDLLGQAAGGEETTAGSAPTLLFLTQRHLLVMKVNWRWLAERERSEAEVLDSSCCRLLRVPLGSVAMYPTRPSAPPAGQHRLDHVLEVLLGQWRLLLVFPLAQDRLLFLGQLRERRDSLSGLKTLVLPRTTRAALKPGQSRGRELTGHCCLCVTPPNPASFTYSVSQQPPVQSISSLLQSLGEENQPPPHLALNLSPGLKLLAGLGGQDLLEYFHNNIAQTEGEEVRQVLWLSVVLYKSPEAELTSCLLLSTNAIYFLLEDSASSLTHHSLWETADSACRDPEAESCYYLTIRLADLLSVNVGLFDQYFRVVGSSADQIVCCLSRDSFGTHGFLQQLMAVLSLQEKVPQPESTEQDFYSHKDTGKMKNYELVHGGRVRFIYPSDEEMGDLTFIVAERKTAASSSSSSFNILLYLLAFQVQTPGSPTATGPSHNPLLEPRTLILTSTDIFLLDEDYVSYPLPDLAKEPPSREKYQVREWRRIRDLDRVLLGYQPVPQALTLVFDDWSGPDLLCHLTMDHFNQETTATAGGGAAAAGAAGAVGGGAVGEVQWCILVPGAESRERLLSLLARQWEALCSRELPVELTG